MIKTPLGWAIIKRVPPPPPPAPDPLDSQDILKREPVTQKAIVKHILLNWKDNNGGGDSEKAKNRDRAALDKLVKETVAKLKKGDAIEPLMKDLSEDPGSAASGDGYPVTPSAGLVEPFKKLSLRLKPGEVGVVKTVLDVHFTDGAGRLVVSLFSAVGVEPLLGGHLWLRRSVDPSYLELGVGSGGVLPGHGGVGVPVATHRVDQLQAWDAFTGLLGNAVGFSSRVE